MAPHELAVRQHHSFRDKCESAARFFKRLHRPASDRSWSPYRPLYKDRMEIRLLLVKAGEGLQDLRCELKHAFLNSKRMPHYETISYCWGDPTITGAIMLNGRSSMVPASSKAAIARMRLPDADRVLWIDALCINQEDPEERGHQVTIMSEIYSNGQQNLVYLGEGDGIIISKALRIIENVLESARQETDGYHKWNDVLWKGGEYRRSDTGIELDTDLKPLFSFFSVAWFKRLWIAQEAALSRTSICYYGSFTIGLEDVVRAAAWLEHKNRFLPFDVNDRPNILNAANLCELCDHSKASARYPGNEKMRLTLILDRMRNFQVMDLRDRIYGILALHERLQGTPILAQWMAPDYSKPLRHIFRDAARFDIMERGDLDIFNDIDTFPFDISVGESWPSWIPHWHISDVDSNTPPYLRNVFHADKDTELQVETVLDNSDLDRLTLSGYLVDTVVECSSVITVDALYDGDELCQIIQDIRALIKGKSIAVDSRDLGATLVAGTNQSFERVTEDECDYFLTWSTYIEQSKQIPSRPERDEAANGSDYAKIWAYELAVLNMLRNRCFFVTTSGSIGIGPRTMQAQDTIAVLHGCQWPVVLRPTDDYHRVLGTCYVHGIMDGEAVRKKQEERKEAEVIIIR